jgi:hypothetical protein
MRRMLRIALLLGMVGLTPAWATPPVFIVPRTGEQLPAPQTDEEALRLLDYADLQKTRAVRGLYHVYRARGDDVLTAYERVLRMQVLSYENNLRKRL